MAGGCCGESEEKGERGGGCCGPKAPPPSCCGPNITSACCDGEEDLTKVQEGVKEYYGEVLKSTNDLRTSACTSCEKPNPKVAQVLNKIPKQVTERFYGCGFPVPLGIENMRLLDLGCGTGRDCYIASALVGEEGKVTGVDMTPQQLEVAQAHAEEYCKGGLGYAKSNMSFVSGYIEDLSSIEPGSIDLAVSNCVVNLSTSKEKVFEELERVLAPGGEFRFSDVFSDRVLPAEMQNHKVLVGECLGGAMEVNQFLSMAKNAGFMTPLMVSKTPIEVHDKELAAILGDTKFDSITYRVFKIPEGDRLGEEDSKTVSYNGSLELSEGAYKVSADLTLQAGERHKVSGDVATILCKSWIQRFFDQHCSGCCC
ncbi:S-adenosyl-L-methionine-dependent methyltransferase [Chloropicon primus]|uniref:Arsenite methyltransferase n=1 Tax=Chloropicon primus TaxID=1764295 RepID=A0A5B8MZ36_9CHLO|nr:S-adenosyl-L-methionine-dependent methyltransferase [Chloropicon primus]UPR04944.1 S-adenosyl-L-methionine-dependent methyltransferase [Chloropicon primus]|eukprot:QDZ25749.1 S-adenosyl-L-methionine-dependent methyltransferase [Chloropicon primus]